MNGCQSFSIYMLFFISGMAGLIYEVVWIRMMVSAFGATAQAVSVVVTSFMAGLALGGWAFGRWIDRLGRPLLAYVCLEVGIAVSAFALPGLLAVSERLDIFFYRLWPESLVVRSVVRFALSSIPLLLPTTFMGATLPVMSKYGVRHPRAIGSTVGSLYSLNIVGAVVGAYLAGFVLIGQYGLFKTVHIAMGLNLLAALIALGLFVAERGPQTPEATSSEQEAGEGKDRAPSRRLMLTVFFITGFTSMAFQILWTKGLALFVDNTVYCYSAMLATFLAGLGLGGYVWSRFLNWEGRLPFRLAVLQLLLGSYGTLTVVLFHHLDRMGFPQRLFMKGDSALAFSLPYFGATVPVLLIPTFLMGLSFPLIVKILISDTHLLGRRLGQAYAVNTLGAIAGSLVAGFVLLPAVGIQKSIVGVAVLNVVIGGILVFVADHRSPPKEKSFYWAGTGAFLVLAFWSLKSEKPLILSTALFREKNYARGDLLFYKEDVAAVVTVRKTKTGERLLEINGKSVAGTAYEYENTQKMQGHLPLLLFGNPKSVLQVGFGSGGSLYAISRHRNINEIHCVEICDSVMAAAPFFKDQNHDILNEPRLKIIHDDAVNYVRKTNRTYDLIMSDSIHPTYAGNGALYSADYFKTCKERLNPGGMMSFWFPLYSLSQADYRIIMRSFLSVFPHASLWYVNTNLNPYTLLVGSEDPFRVDVDRLARDFGDPPVAQDLRLIGIETPFDLLNCFVLAEEPLANFCGRVGPLNTDQHPIIEFSVPRLRKIGREGSWLLNFRDLVRARTPVSPYFIPLARSPSAQMIQQKMAMLYEATGPLLEGQIAQLAGVRDAALASYQKALSINPESSGAKTLTEYLYREKAERFRREKKLDLAIQSYRQALQVSPRSPKSHNNLATLFLAVGQTDLAEAHFKQAMEADPAYVTPLLNLGFLSRDRGQFDRAAEYFRAAREIDPTSTVTVQGRDPLPTSP